MLTNLIFSDSSRDVRVVYKTDLQPGDVGNFTVLDIEGLSDAEVVLGIDFQIKETTVQAFITKADEVGLKLERLDEDGLVVLADYDDDSSESSS